MSITSEATFQLTFCFARQFYTGQKLKFPKRHTALNLVFNTHSKEDRAVLYPIRIGVENANLLQYDIWEILIFVQCYTCGVEL